LNKKLKNRWGPEKNAANIEPFATGLNG